MHSTAQEIVSLFRKGSSELSTSQILDKINSEYSLLRKSENLSGEDSVESKRKTAQLHRKVLHHLNRLVRMGILGVTRHGEKGEKFFSLRIGEDEEILEASPGYKKRVVISRQIVPSMPIEGYEQQGIVFKYEPATWIDRLSSVIVFCEKFVNTDSLYKALIENIFPVVNDSVSLEGFEILMNRFDLSGFVEQIGKDSEDYGKIINLNIEVSELKDGENLDRFLSSISRMDFKNVRFVFSMSDDDIEDYSSLILKILEIFSKHRVDFYVKNKRVQKAPYFVGRAGPYCVLDKEWQLADELKKNITCLGCSQSSVVVDVNRFYEENGLSIPKFSDLMFNISKSMLSANSIQRRKSDDCFRLVNFLNKGYEPEFLVLSRNYIRFWNFGLHQEGMNPEFVLNMISEAKKRISEFSAAEETIYKSCGMTTRFKLALAPAFESAGKLSSAKYRHLQIKSSDDLYKKEVRKNLKDREISSDIFDGGDEVTFHIYGIIDIEDLLKQLNAILSNYKIPLFNYNFSNVKGDTKITSFFG